MRMKERGWEVEDVEGKEGGTDGQLANTMTIWEGHYISMYIITPNNFVLTELASQKRKEAIKNCI